MTRFTRGALASFTLAAGLAVGLATTAGAQPDNETDFLECVVDHQDTDGIGVCCIFYGGELDGDACYIDVAEELAPQSRPTTPSKPGKSVPRAPLTTVAQI